MPENNKPDHKHEYGCAMLFISFPSMKRVHKFISQDDIYTDPADPGYGLETEPHCTLLYGLHEEVTVEQITAIVTKYNYGQIMAHNMSVFENDKFDVLKFEVSSSYLKKINADLQSLPHTSTYPDYKPHITVAYLKPGTGAKYVELFKKGKIWLSPTKVVYSMVDGNSVDIAINTNIPQEDEVS